ncbi:MAG: hypothetical protein M5U07_03750 [Xanthobacteraceae bacterium]|nr:hypothetical protein [Xanthobacteraceae bacterium]PWB64509.1 MAG: hypothetical protein C3F17_06975 [Bradyrhizobiaceae bacterium]
MEFSLPGLLGAFVGIVLGVINYGVVIAVVEKRLRALDKSRSPAEKAEFERKVSLLRRIVLGLDIVVFAAIGYWFGRTMGG